MIKAIFWDNDGVLVDTERLYFEATRRVLAPVGIDLDRELFIELFLVQGKGAWHLAAEQGLTQPELDALRDQRNALYTELLDSEPLVIDGVTEVLDALRGRCLMGVVTSSRPDHFERIHRNTGLLPFFDFVIASGDSPRSKPHPDPYLEALARSGFKKHECLVVEDSNRGLQAAVATGLRCVAVPTDLTRGSDFSAAYRVIDRLQELLPLLDELGR